MILPDFISHFGSMSFQFQIGLMFSHDFRFTGPFDLFLRNACYGAAVYRQGPDANQGGGMKQHACLNCRG